VPEHAATIHESQGAEYPAVVIALYGHYTRKALVVVVGQRKPSPSRCTTGRRRWSKLGGG
jgi:hypothetical protein